MSPKIKWHQNANVTKMQMSSKSKCHQNANVTKTQMSPKCKYPKTQMSPKLKCHQIANNTKTQMSPKGQCHQNANVTKMQISPLELTFVFLYLSNGSGKTRSPDLVHINPNWLPGHGLSDSRLVFVSTYYSLILLS